MTVRDFHRRAMIAADAAILADKEGDSALARARFLRAAKLEQDAIDAMTEESTEFTARVLRGSLESLMQSARHTPEKSTVRRRAEGHKLQMMLRLRNALDTDNGWAFDTGDARIVAQWPKGPDENKLLVAATLYERKDRRWPERIQYLAVSDAAVLGVEVTDIMNNDKSQFRLWCDDDIPHNDFESPRFRKLKHKGLSGPVVFALALLMASILILLAVALSL
jgi:hypothetical protein